MLRFVLVVFVCLSAAGRAAAQTPPTAPKLRRWLDVQHLQLASRFRWVQSNRGVLTSSTHQWQPQIRARVLFDAAARVSLHVGAFGGSHFVSGWNNTGGGLGTFGGDFHVKQVFVAVQPRDGLELQAGGLYILRGENTEIAAYDNDAYIVGERLTLRYQDGPVSQVSFTVGHIGDYRTPNVFRRLDAIADITYGQLLVGGRIGERVNVSMDYTYEDTRDILREAATVRLPAATAPLSSVKVEAYQRISNPDGYGFNLSGDLRFTRAFNVTAGVTHIDREYLIPGYLSPNGDRYERGTRFYTQGTYSLTRDLSIGWFQSKAFNISYDIPNEQRWEVIVTLNPTATLKAKRIF